MQQPMNLDMHKVIKGVRQHNMKSSNYTNTVRSGIQIMYRNHNSQKKMPKHASED